MKYFRPPDIKYRFKSKPSEDMDEDDLAILKACDKFRHDNKMPFCDILHVVAIMKELGWKKGKK